MADKDALQKLALYLCEREELTPLPDPVIAQKLYVAFGDTTHLTPLQQALLAEAIDRLRHQPPIH